MELQGKGPIEYIIVIAIVLVIATGIILAVLGPGDETDVIEQGTGKIVGQTTEIQILDTAVHPDGNFYFLIKNLYDGTVTITTIDIAGLEADFQEPIFHQNEREFIVETNVNCQEWETVFMEVDIKYKTGYGLEKTQRYPSEVGLLCEKYTLIDSANAAKTKALRPGE